MGQKNNIVLNHLTRQASYGSMLFGAFQAIYFVLFPVLAQITCSSLSQIVSIFGLGTLVFLFSTQMWGKKIHGATAIKIMRIGLMGLVLAHGLIIALFYLPLTFRQDYGLYIFILARVLYAVTTSGMVPVGQYLHLISSSSSSSSEFSDQKGRTQRKILHHSIYFNGGRLLGLVCAMLFSGHSAWGLICLSVLTMVLFIKSFFHIPGNLMGLDVSIATKKPQAFAGKSLSFPFSLFLLLPLLFTTCISYFHSSLSFFVVALVQTSQQKTLALFRFFFWGLLLVVLLQALLHKKAHWPKVINQVSGALLLLLAGCFLFHLSLGQQNWFLAPTFIHLWPHVLLIALAVAIVPVCYSQLLFEYFPEKEKGMLASQINFQQTLGNAIGPSVLGLVSTLGITPLRWVGVGLTSIFFLSTLLSQLWEKTKGRN